MAVKYECDNCQDEVEEVDVYTVTVHRGNDVQNVSHLDQECFDLAVKGDGPAIEAALIG